MEKEMLALAKLKEGDNNFSKFMGWMVTFFWPGLAGPWRICSK